MNPSVLRAVLALLVLGLPGCLLIPPDQAFPGIGDDDDATGDDDDATGDDDDATGDDDDATDPPLPACEFDADLPGSQDGDQDGWPPRAVGDEECDCDDANPSVHPEAAEVFDLVVNDCDVDVGYEELPASLAGDSPARSLYDGWEGIDGALGHDLSIGDIDADGTADLCVRAGGYAYVLLDYIGAFMAEVSIDAFDLITIGGLDENGSIDCSADINGEGGTDVLINHWPDPSGTGSAGGGQLVLFDGDAVADGIYLDPGEALASWPPNGQIDIAWRALCLATGDFSTSPGEEVIIGAIPAVNPNQEAQFRILGFETPASVPTFVSRGTSAVSTNLEPYSVRCWGLGDINDSGRDDVLLEGGMGAELWFAEEIAGGSAPAVDFSAIDVTSATSGDYTGDGVPDLAIGAGWIDGGGEYVSGAAIVRGGLATGEWTEVAGDAGGVTPAYGVNFTDDRENSGLGAAVCTVGDVDGDGRDELLMTAPRIDDEFGEARLYQGRLWDEWVAQSDNGSYPRGTETSRFAASTEGGGFGDVNACDMALPRSINAAPWPLIAELWAWPDGGEEASRVWTWEPYPDP